MKLVASDSKLTSVQLGDGGKVINRSKDGTFHVDAALGKGMVKSGEWGVAGTTFASARGYRCACGHLSVFKDSCGRCGSTDLTLEE